MIREHLFWYVSKRDIILKIDQTHVGYPGPKKILACDGGGMLGLLSVEILIKLKINCGPNLAEAMIL